MKIDCIDDMLLCRINNEPRGFLNLDMVVVILPNYNVDTA